MKKLFLLALAMLPAFASAQQITNANFDGTWVDCNPYLGSGVETKVTGKQPESWCMSHVAGMKAPFVGWQGATIIGSSIADKGTGQAVELRNTANPTKKDQIVPAYLTLGKSWNTAIGYNAKNKDGGTFGGIQFTNRPDAVKFSFKRSAKDASVPATVVAYLWKGTWSQANVPVNIALTSPKKETMTDRDCNILGKPYAQGGAVTSTPDAKLVASLEQSIATVTDQWQDVTYEFKYADETAIPEKMNIIFAANDYFDANKVIEGNTLSVDDVQFIYYHELKSFTYDGVPYEVTGSSIDLSSVAYDATKTLTFVKKGVGAEIQPVAYDANTAVLTVEVRGNDYATNNASKTVYTIQFKKALAVAAGSLASLNISGEAYALTEGVTEYTLPYVYNPGIVFEPTAAAGSELVPDSAGKTVSYDNVAKTVTIRVENSEKQETTYVFKFTEAEASAVQAGDYKGSLSVVLTTPEGQTTVTPLSNSTIVMSGNSNGTVNLALNDFSFAGIPVGDIFVSNLPVNGQSVEGTRVLVMTDFDEAGNPVEGMGSMLGAIPVKVSAQLLENKKYAEASIDIVTANHPMLGQMFAGIHVDFVSYQVDQKDALTDGFAGRSYYPYVTATGRVTKSSAKYLQLNNSYVDTDGKQRDLPMTYVDLSGASVDSDVTLADIMHGAPARNNTLVYVAGTCPVSGPNVVTGNTATELVLTDSIEFKAPKSFNALKVRYDRVFAQGETAGATIVLPFSADATQIGGTLYRFNGMNDGVLDFVKESSLVKAHTPYLLINPSADPFAGINYAKVNVTPAEQPSVVVGDFSHVGTFSAVAADAQNTNGCYDYTAEQFEKLSDNALAPFHTYIVNAGADQPASFKVSLDGVVMGKPVVSAASLEKLLISGEAYALIEGVTEYTLPYVYNPGIVFEPTAAAGSELVADAAGKTVSYDNVAKTVTIRVENSEKQETTYVFKFTEAEASAVQAGDYKGSLSVVLTTPEGQTTVTPLSNSTIVMSGNSNGTVNLALNDFSFAGIPVGDIFVSNLPVNGQSVEGTRVLVMTDFDEAGNPVEGMGSMLGAIPVKVSAQLLENKKYAEASIDIVTANHPMLGQMFAGIHVDFVSYQVDQKDALTDGFAGRSYYPYVTATGRVTKSSAKYLQLNNSYVDTDGKQRDLPMTYVDLSGASVDSDVTLADIMHGAPARNNTLVYVAGTCPVSGPNVVTGNTATELVLTDSIEFKAPKSFNALKVRYDRVFAQGETAGATIVLPFSADATQIGGTLYRFNGMNDGVLDFVKESSLVKAHTPYLLINPSADPFAGINYAKVNVTPAEQPSVVVGDFSHVGTFSAVAADAQNTNGCYDYTAEQFEKLSDNALAPFHTYIVNAGADQPASFKVSLDGVVMGKPVVSAASLEKLLISGEAYALIEGVTEYTLPYVYNPGIVFEPTAAAGSELVADAAGKTVSYDNVAKTVTIRVKNSEKQETTYVFKFTEAEASAVQAGDYKGSLSVVLTTPEGQTTVTPLSNSTIVMSGNSNGTVNLALNDFSFAGIPVGDIFVSNLPVNGQSVEGTRVLVMTDFDEAGNPVEGMGSMLGAIPVKVSAQLLENKKYAEASIDIVTANHPMLGQMFAGIHVDFVSYQVDQKDALTDGFAGRSYYPYVTATGRVTKSSAKYLQLNNSYVDTDGKQRDLPMTYVDLSGASVDSDVTLADIMHGAPARNNTLVYVAGTCPVSGPNVVTGKTASEIVLTDAVEFFAPKFFTAFKVNYDRAFEQGENAAATVVLPFSADATQVGGSVYRFAGVKGDVLDFTKENSVMEANVPYLIVNPTVNPMSELTLAMFKATPAEQPSVVVGDFSHVGTFAPVAVNSSNTNNCYDYKGDKFEKLADNSLLPFHTYITNASTNQLDSFKVSLDGVVTGIWGAIVNGGKVDVYTIEGKLVRRNVSAETSLIGLPNGVYVVGGKKVIK